VPKLKGGHQAVQEFGLIGPGPWLHYFDGLLRMVYEGSPAGK
jgi:hypothetical protein